MFPKPPLVHEVECCGSKKDSWYKAFTKSTPQFRLLFKLHLMKIVLYKIIYCEKVKLMFFIINFDRCTMGGPCTHYTCKQLSKFSHGLASVSRSYSFSDQATLHNSSYINRHDCKILRSGTTPGTIEHQHDSPKINIWCELTHDGILDPFICVKRTILNIDVYCDILELLCLSAVGRC